MSTIFNFFQNRQGVNGRKPLGALFLLGICIGAIVLCTISSYGKPYLPWFEPTPFATQSPNETLVVIADLENRDSSAESRNEARWGAEFPQSIYEIVQENISGSEIPIRIEKCTQPILTQSDARQILTANHALMVVWGWYDQNRAEVIIDLDTKHKELEMPMFADVSTAYITQSDIKNPMLEEYSAFLVLGIARFHDIWHTGGDEEYFSRAIAQADDAQGHINSWAALFWRGLVFSFMSEKREAAIAYFSQSIELYPARESYYNRGFTNADLGNVAAAYEDYSQAIKLDGQYTRALNGRRIIHEFQGEYELAIVDLSRVIDIDPTYDDVYSQRGMLYYYVGELELAMADCNQAIALNPDAANAYLVRGMIYENWGMMDKAILDYQRVNELAPTAHGFCTLGKAYAQVGDFDAAVDTLERGVGMDQQNLYTWCQEALRNAERGIPPP